MEMIGERGNWSRINNVVLLALEQLANWMDGYMASTDERSASMGGLAFYSLEISFLEKFISPDGLKVLLI